MPKSLRVWLSVCLVLGVSLILLGLHLGRSGSLPPHEVPGVQLAMLGGMGLCLVALVALWVRRTVAALLEGERSDEELSRALHHRHPYWTLFLASFVALFVEVMLIRYCSSQIRIFAFYKNVPLVSAFLGLGLGCCLGDGRTGHALAFLLWLLPLATFLCNGAVLVNGYLGTWAALGSSEHILGDVVVTEASLGQAVQSQVFIGLACVATLVAITCLFALLGRLLGEAFEALPRLVAYTVNIVGSLAGILLFLACSYLQQPPWTWFVIGLGPLLWWMTKKREVLAAAVLILTSVLAVMPSYGHTVWSRYQKLVGHEIPAGPAGTGTASPAYLVQISDVFYQIAMDLRPAIVAPLPDHPLPHYDGAFQQIPIPQKVLVVGSGTGNDVAAALRAGASHVDAVDIDPAIMEMGRRHHPERPYDDRRVEAIVDDARAAFRRQPAGTYDAVVFGLLDSHTQLGMSSVRLDNYVFTLESFASARRLLKPGGHLVITAASFRPWFRQRFIDMLGASCGGAVKVSSFGPWWTYVCRVENPEAPTPHPSLAKTGPLPTDDWPFLYLPQRGIPMAYLTVVGMLALASVLVLKLGGLEPGRYTSYHAHLFLLGAAFLLMEVYAINRLALLFGSTWLVSAVTIALVLTLIVGANLTVLMAGVNTNIGYGLLFTSLILSYWLEPSSVLGRGFGLSLAYGLFVLSPVFFAGLIFARSFSVATLAGPAIGANILGSVLGGWAEYATMAVGIRAMALLALAFYVASLLLLIRTRRRSVRPGLATLGT